MKALRIVGAIIGALIASVVLAGAIFYFGWLMPPSPKSVCDNIARITEAETGLSFDKAATEKCIANASERPRFGILPWVAQLKCMRDAKDRAALEACSKR